MTKHEMYNEIEAGWKTQTTHNGLTAEACHGLMHLDAAFNALLSCVDGDALHKEYERQVDKCLACNPQERIDS